MTQFSIGAFVVIFDKKGRVLLSHRRDLDLWNLPGGSVESGELPTAAAVRETREETGLKIKLKDLVGIYGKPHRDEFVFVFTAKVVGGKLKNTAEADANRYFKVNKLPENTIPKHVGRIKDAASFAATATNEIPKPTIRWQKTPSAREMLKQLEKKNGAKKKNIPKK
jgi:ADP-ribose pyrophosphatase YjhB (NUDIX family)